MSTDVFGSDFARAYDLWYEEKDYESECDLIERIFQRNASWEIRSILDLGCGTGGHALPLARRGYAVTGVDRSEAMLSIARQKAQGQIWGDGTKAPAFIHSDLRSLDLGRRFDAVLMMFAVLGYQASNEDLTLALTAVRRHLNPGGLFAGDVWYGPAVLTIRPSDRVRVVRMGETELIRTAAVAIDSLRHLCSVHYQIWGVRDRELVIRQEEDHTMRFFFPLELEYHMRTTGLDPIGLYPFPELDGQPNEATWNVLFCGRALPE
ncbi:MAG TPA: methyltransferase domain-containing protein [Anaerolineales bacterium]|nr:methyltransferase domain-containing protein [Anaerolineales bacterium]